MGGAAWVRVRGAEDLVAYAIAKIAHDVKEHGRAVDFARIWRRQSPGPAIDEALVTEAEAVLEVLVSPPDGISNVTEWAKKQACWSRVSNLGFEFPSSFLEDLISTEERRESERLARRAQRELNGMEAQIAVVMAGPGLWEEALAWGTEHRLLTQTDERVLRIAANRRGKTPTDKQSVRAIETLRRLQSEGFAGELSPPS